MKGNLGRVKFVIFLASVILLALIGLIVFQLISINKYEREISRQESIIEELNNQLDYYKQHSPTPDDENNLGE